MKTLLIASLFVAISMSAQPYIIITNYSVVNADELPNALEIQSRTFMETNWTSQTEDGNFHYQSWTPMITDGNWVSGGPSETYMWVPPYTSTTHLYGDVTKIDQRFVVFDGKTNVLSETKTSKGRISRELRNIAAVIITQSDTENYDPNYKPQTIWYTTNAITPYWMTITQTNYWK